MLLVFAFSLVKCFKYLVSLVELMNLLFLNSLGSYCFSGRAIDGGPKLAGQASVRAEDVAITMDERRPLINRDPVVTIDTVSHFLPIS